MKAYYNEIDRYAAQHLRNLIDAGHIADGIVDERSIEDVLPSDLRGFTQCHFFAGVGVWSYALRLAGWPDDRPVWTGSCPCQPFSAAGQGAAFADERHLWPHFFHLISECQPSVVFGEQVASKDAGPWIDLVQTDMEAVGFAFGAVAFPSAGVGAPHIRDRAYWVANTADLGQHGRRPSETRNGLRTPWIKSERFRNPCGKANANELRQQPTAIHELHDAQCDAESCGSAGGLEHAGQHHDACQGQAPSARQPQAHGSTNQPSGSSVSPCTRPGPVNGPWRDADWILCRDGKWRAVEPGTFPLAHGAPARVGRLRSYGNAINSQAAVAFIEATGLVE